MLRRFEFACVFLLTSAVVGCKGPDPRALTASAVETYWVVDSSSGQTVYLAPAVRLRLRNEGPLAQRSVQMTATFRRVGEDEVWGTDWQQIAVPKKPLAPGESVEVTLRSDGRYYSTGVAEAMFGNPDFKDARAEVFVRSGSSGWVKLDLADRKGEPVAVERRIGSLAAQAFR